MLPLPSLPFVVLDTETTGFTPKTNRVIEFASMRLEKGKVIDEYETLISIAEEVPATVRVLTRIEPAMLSGKPKFVDIRNEIVQHIGADTIIVGQNVGFDIRMLKGEGIDLSERPWIDTSMLASLVFPELLSFSLGYVSSVLQLNHEPKHRALGDVRATLELFQKCWERITALPAGMQKEIRAIFTQSSPGYRLLAEAMPRTSKMAAKPLWLVPPARTARRLPAPSPKLQTALAVPAKGQPSLVEESPDPSALQSIVDAAIADTSTTHWIAVKNLDASIRRLTYPAKEVRVIVAAHFLLDPHAQKKFLMQETFTSDEASLALKLRWFAPTVLRDIAMHGEERSVWYGKLACTEESPAYCDQFAKVPGVVLIDQQHLLTIFADPKHAGNAALNQQSHVIIDDSSMLEDTATKAWRWQCVLDHLRAAAEGHKELTKFLDLFQLWIERIRAYQDVRYLMEQDLDTDDVESLKERLEVLLQDDVLPSLVRKNLQDLRNILDVANIEHRIAWIEQRQGGSQFIQSVPERVGPLLSGALYEAHPTTLLIPSGSSATLREIVAKTDLKPVSPFAPFALPLTIKTDLPLGKLLTGPMEGKTIVLVGSRRIIEEHFVRDTEALERRGVTLICQNLSGGLERMQAEFVAAEEPAVWLLTPWTFEEVELPAGTVSRLVISSVPFDHPSHTVLSRRAAFYGDPFNDYFLPRLEHRIFRLIRTFCRHRTEDGQVLVTDDRLATKNYGRRVKAYLERFASKEEVSPQKKVRGKAQMGLFNIV
ncbi:MAG: exonuclease domain-containing protein [Candidatus Peregrinibacteria bacterium]